MSELEKLQVLANSTDALQRADYLTYEQFAIAFNLSSNGTVANWVTRGLLPVKYLNPLNNSKPVIDMKKYRVLLEEQPIGNKFQKTKEIVEKSGETLNVFRKKVM